MASKDYQKTPGLKQEAYCVIQFLWVGNLRQLNGVILLQSFFDDEKMSTPSLDDLAGGET